jgi:catechol 2,3-dioxygenase-like lactoylglutathione lyase family enzyme
VCDATRTEKLAPNLVVADVARSITFYRDVLGFSGATVPEESPYVFASVQSGPVEIFLNAPEAVMAEYPAFRDRPIGGTLTLFLEVSDVRQAQ